VFLPAGYVHRASEPLPVHDYFKAWCREMLRDRPCVTCGKTARAFRHIPAGMVLCIDCANAEAADIERQAKERGDGSRKTFESRLMRCGLLHQERILRDLDLHLDDPTSVATGWVREALKVPSAKARHAASVAVVNRYLDAVSRGTLVLSGPPGTGKSTCAAFAAWRTHGCYLPREKWSSIAPWDLDEIQWIRQLGGVVVLDEVCVMNGKDLVDRQGAVEVCGLLVKGRHAANLPTIVTTNADREDFFEAYGALGEAIFRRANVDLGGASVGGGFVDVGAKA
jgi:hypothetical protein